MVGCVWRCRGIKQTPRDFPIKSRIGTVAFMMSKTIVLSVFLFLPAAGYCDVDDAAAPASTCPGAVAWNDAHRDQLPKAMELRDAKRTFSEPDLHKQLQKRIEADQSVRKEYLAAPHDVRIRRQIEMIDEANLAWFKGLVRKSGIPTADQVGEGGVEWAWLIAQHADRDPQFQALVLPMFRRRYEDGELPAENLAKLVDRLLVARNQPQRFGTQFDWTASTFKLRGRGAIAEVDENRKKIGLMSLDDYACMMNERLKNRGQHDLP